MRIPRLSALALPLTLLSVTSVAEAQLIVNRVSQDLAQTDPKAPYWSAAETTQLMLMAQPMVAPRPKLTTTQQLRVQAVHDGQRVAFRLKWPDPDRSEAGRIDQFSDAVAIQFPVGGGDTPPAVFMGAKGSPVHIFHWRAQYQRDRERGKPTMKELYPNLSVDMYPMEFKDHGAAPVPTAETRDTFSPGRAQGNPQSYVKNAVDEIYAEGFATSSVQEGHSSSAVGIWENGEWTVVITRELAREGGSALQVGGKSFLAAAVWQGNAQEVGSRKSVTMTWTPIQIAGAEEAKR